MPIYAPTLPPRPALDKGAPAFLVLLRFDFRRVLRLRLGRFFGFAFILILIVQCAWLYTNHLVGTQASLSAVRPLAEQILPQGAKFQINLLHPAMLALLWFQVALVGGGLVARDTLYRIRPLLYAHPVGPLDYLAAKGLFAVGLPFLIQLTFIFLPWVLSLAVAGSRGPVWPTAPLHLIPAALITSVLMGAVTLGASSMAASPRAGFGWAVGIQIGSGAVGGILATTFGNSAWNALALGTLTQAWPRLLFNLPGPRELGWVPVLLATAAHLVFWIGLARFRTRPSEAIQ